MKVNCHMEYITKVNALYGGVLLLCIILALNWTVLNHITIYQESNPLNILNKHQIDHIDCLDNTTNEIIFSKILWNSIYSPINSYHQNPKLFKQQLHFIRSLKYLIISIHGGVLSDTLSYLSDQIQIPQDNIVLGSVPPYAYCDMLKHSYFHDKYNKNISNIVKYLYKSGSDIPDASIKNYFYNYHSNNNTNNNLYKFDVIICPLPALLCQHLWPYAKVFIFRFMHRFDHGYCSESDITHLHPKDMLIYSHKQNYAFIKQLSIAAKCKHIIMSSCNMFDYVYTKQIIDIQYPNDILFWPHVALNFPQMYDINYNISDSINVFKFIYFVKGTCEPLITKDFEQLNSNLFNDSNGKIQLIQSTQTNMFDDLFNGDANGVIFFPYSSYTVKWLEFYRIGIPLFIPSVSLWIKLHQKCGLITDNYACNEVFISTRAEDRYKKYQNITNNQNGFCMEKYLNPFDLINYPYFLKYTDFYSEEYMPGIYTFDNIEDLKEILKEYASISREEKLTQKYMQINQVNRLSELFEPHLVNELFDSYHSFDDKCHNKLMYTQQSAYV
eukprot:183100_1